MSVLIPAAAKLAGPVQRLIAMGIDAGIKPGELYTPRCRLAEVRRVASEQRSEAHTKGEVSTARTCSLRCRLDPLHGSDADADCPCRPLDAHAVLGAA